MKWIWTRPVLLTWTEPEITIIVHNHDVKTIMTTKNLNTIEALELFIQGNQFVVFSVLGNKTERYIFIRKRWLNFDTSR